MPGPVRTCVGCRRRAPATELLRLVVEQRPDGTAALRPDPGRRLPGRGASLHPSAECLALAERRRAFGRALRQTGPLDLSAVRATVGGPTR
jgi:predicted RNA-binding protein YlxR (DUF448 family)